MGPRTKARKSGFGVPCPFHVPCPFQQCEVRKSGQRRPCTGPVIKTPPTCIRRQQTVTFASNNLHVYRDDANQRTGGKKHLSATFRTRACGFESSVPPAGRQLGKNVTRRPAVETVSMWSNQISRAMS